MKIFLELFNRRVIIQLFILFIFFNGTTFAQPDDGEILDSSYNENVISMTRLIATPNNYNGKEVTFSGYYHNATHLSGIFLDKDSCLESSTENAILLSTSLGNGKDYCHCERITVTGIIKHSREYYGIRYKSDIYLEETKIVDE